MLISSARLKPLLILREAFISLLPIVLVMNILVMLSGLTSLLESWGLSGVSAINGDEINRLYYFLIPLFVNLSLSLLLAKEKDLDQIGSLLIAMVCFFRASGFLSVGEAAQITSYHGSILTSIPFTWLAIRLLHAFSKKSRLKIVKRRDDISPRLANTLNLIVPGLLTVFCFEVVGQLVRVTFGLGVLPLVAEILPTVDYLSALPELILYKTFALCTWFIGLHGDYSAAGLFRLLYNIPAGESAAIRMKPFHDVFMSIGGSGSTFIIPFIVLFSKRKTQFRSIAKLSLPFAFFNVNETLLFGLPILLNPVFFIPFFATAFINMAIALTAMQLGAFSIEPIAMHWMTPPLYNAYIASDGSVWAVFTQLTCIVVDGFIYLPFIVLANRQCQAPLELLKLFGEDAHGFVHEEISHRQERMFVAKQKAVLNDAASAQKVLKQLKDGQFLLYFQPKMDARSLKVVGLEALLRFRDRDGNILPPTFLPVLYRQGLSKAVDKKVVNLAFWQILRWRLGGLAVPPIAVNFDKDFLLDPQAVGEFIDRAKQYNIQFHIEITEHTYTVELHALASVIRRLRAAGHRISIDDFGAGYSSLTSLVALEADEIKLDRALVVAPEGEDRRGKILLASSIQMCHDLGFTVVAEGVETKSHLALVQRCGVDVVQGYYLGRPIDAVQVSQLFACDPAPEKDDAKLGCMQEEPGASVNQHSTQINEFLPAD